MSETTTAEPKGEIALLPPITAIQLFTDGGVRSILDQIKAEAKSRVIDPSTESGRKEIKSLAYKIAQTKTAMDEMGKSLTEEQREFINRINAERKTIVTELDELKEEIRRPVTEYENREKERVAAHEARIARFKETTENTNGMDGAAIDALIAKVEAFDPSGMDEFTGRAETEKGAALHRLGKLRDEIGAAEMKAAAVEAERLAAEEKARQEREARIAAEAAERARIEAEQKAAEDARRAEEAREAERKAEAARVAEEARKAEEAREAERRAEQERLAEVQRQAEEQRRKAEAEEAAHKAKLEAAEREKAAAELQAKEAAERAERERIATEERHRIALAEAETKARLEAEDKERQRLAQIEAERIAEEKRAANQKHRAAVIRKAAKAFETYGFTDQQADNILALIVDGEIPAVSIQF